MFDGELMSKCMVPGYNEYLTSSRTCVFKLPNNSTLGCFTFPRNLWLRR